MLLVTNLMVFVMNGSDTAAEPVKIIGEHDSVWDDTFNDTTGIDDMNGVTVNQTRGDVTLKGYWNNFDTEPLGTITGWGYESVGPAYHHYVKEDPYEAGGCLHLAMNDDLSAYHEHKLWKEFDTYLEMLDFHLTPFEMKGTNRQGYLYIEFYNTTGSVVHEVRYYWDDTRSGVPPSSPTLTVIDLGWIIPTGGPDMGDIKYHLHENISEEIDANPSVDLGDVLFNSTTFRYGFYQDAGPDWIQIDQVDLDNLGIHPPTNTGYLTSIQIPRPQGFQWNSVHVNKTVPGVGNYLNITIIDGTTFEVIDGFTNLSGEYIDVSMIDPVAHPTIRLVAYLVGNGSATPVLHNWTVTWANVISPPTGLTVTNPLTGYSLILSWNPNPESDITRYILYCSTDNITFHSIANVSVYTFSFTHYGLDLGTTYYYKIAAGDDVPSQSVFSMVVDGTADRDYDGDGIGDMDDPDDDNDGMPDVDDPYPKNPLNYLEDTGGSINATVNDIQDQIADIQLDVDAMNTTLGDLQADIDYINQTLPLKIDYLANQLTEVNDSLMNRVSEVEINILEYLAGLNASLSVDISNLLTSITNDIISMNSSLSDILTTLMNDMTTEHNALEQWLDIVLGEIGSNLTATNATLHKQMDYLDTLVTGFHYDLASDIGDISSDLLLHDQNTGQDHSDIIGLLNAVLDGQIEKERIAELRTMLIDLAGNLSEHDQAIADDIMDVVSDIDEFETETDRQLTLINTTLEDLEKLEEILGDLEALDQSLEQAEDEIQDSIDERSTKKEDEERFVMIELFLIILLILLVINMILTALTRKKIDSMKETGDTDGMAEEGKKTENATPESIDEEPDRSPPRPPSNV